MLRSKSSRSAFSDFGNKSGPSVLSRTLSASKFCRGDALVSQIDSNALKSFGRRSLDRKPSKFATLTDSQITRVLTMQEHMGQLEEELKWAKERLVVVEGERNRALNEIRETKRVASGAKPKVSDALSPKKAGEMFTEIKTLKELLSNSQEELKVKDRNIESLKQELDQAKEFEVKLAEKDALLYRLKEEMMNLRESEAHAMDSLSVSKNRIDELQDEVQRGRVSAAKMLDSLSSQTKQLEQTKIKLEESVVQIASLNDKIVLLESSSKQNNRDLNNQSFRMESANVVVGETEDPKSELELAKKNMSGTQEDEKIASSMFKSFPDENRLLKTELRLAIDAEEKSKKAMDDLALALKEVATEANLAKEKASVTELQLEQVKSESEQLKLIVRITEERYEKLLDEAKNEAELYRNTADRLRLEAEETLLAWNGKELGFVSCIRRAEEEKAIAQHENNRLTESLKAAERITRSAKEESLKLRDILKQAINEANAAKAASGIARDENSQLKDYLAEKDEALHFLTQENERLRISEAAAYENIKEFKHLLSTASTEFKTQDKEQDVMLKSPNLMVEEHEEEDKAKKNFSFSLDELKLLNDSEDSVSPIRQEDPVKAEALKGSIFDTDASPRSEPQTPKSVTHHRRYTSSNFTDDGETPLSEDLDHLITDHFDDSDGDRNHRRKKALFRRVSDLLTRKSFHRREASTEFHKKEGSAECHKKEASSTELPKKEASVE